MSDETIYSDTRVSSYIYSLRNYMIRLHNFSSFCHVWIRQKKVSENYVFHLYLMAILFQKIYNSKMASGHCKFDWGVSIISWRIWSISEIDQEL